MFFDSFIEVVHLNLVPLILFAIPLAISPGPNNVLLATSGANNGFKKTIPQIAGVQVGFLTLMILGGIGLGTVYEYFPKFSIFVKVLGCFYLAYLGINIIRAKSNLQTENLGESLFKPISFNEAFVFQFVNPKALVIVSSMLAGFTLSGEMYLPSFVLILCTVPLVGIPCICIWSLFGGYLKTILKDEKLFKRFNKVMGALTISSIYFIV